MVDATGHNGTPQYVPEMAFPAYSYVTGRWPHPIRDPAGHSFGLVVEQCERPNPERWHDCRTYLRGLDLFNHGYYWESHEVWEGLWHACGRRSAAADFFKGLIKLAAAGVKVREGRSAGVRTHALRAAELFRSVRAEIDTTPDAYCGLSLTLLIEQAERVADEGFSLAIPTAAAVEVVFPFQLLVTNA